MRRVRFMIKIGVGTFTQGKLRNAKAKCDRIEIDVKDAFNMIYSFVNSTPCHATDRKQIFQRSWP